MRFVARRVVFLTIRHARRLIESLVTRRILTESQFPTAFRARPRKPVTWIDGEGIPWCALLYGPLQYSRVLKPQRVEFEILTRIYFISGEATSQSVDKFYQVHCQLPNSEIAKTRDFHGEPPVFFWPLAPNTRPLQNRFPSPGGSIAPNLPFIASSHLRLASLIAARIMS